jgi:hypothetical protein
MMRRMLRKLPE